MERKPGYFLEHRAMRGIAQGQIVAYMASLAEAKRGLKIKVPNGGGTVKMLGRKFKPEAGRLLRVEEDQVGGPLPLPQRFAGAEFEEFMRRDHDMPVGLICERTPLVSAFDAMTQLFEPFSEQVADFVEEVIAERTSIERKAQRRWRRARFFAHKRAV